MHTTANTNAANVRQGLLCHHPCKVQRPQHLRGVRKAVIDSDMGHGGSQSLGSGFHQQAVSSIASRSSGAAAASVQTTDTCAEVTAAIDQHIQAMGPQVVTYAQQCEVNGLSYVKLYDLARVCMPLKIKKDRSKAKRPDSAPATPSPNTSSDSESPSRLWGSLGRASYDFVR